MFGTPPLLSLFVHQVLRLGQFRNQSLTLKGLHFRHLLRSGYVRMDPCLPPHSQLHIKLVQLFLENESCLRYRQYLLPLLRWSVPQILKYVVIIIFWTEICMRELIE